jgi:DNA-binding response OmpR family regulator
MCGTLNAYKKHNAAAYVREGYSEGEWNMAFKVLLVEDDRAILAANTRVLEAEDYQVATARTLQSAREQLVTFNPDIMVLDIMMPDGSGLDFCKEIRAHSDVHVLFLSALDTTQHIVEGLLTGGDDYLTKPYELQELCARIAAQTRRIDEVRSSATTEQFGGLTLSFANQTASYEQADMQLKPKEFLILAALIRESDVYHTSAELYETAWGNHAYNDLRTVIVHISNLRSKLKAHVGEQIFIERDSERGYRIRRKD